MRRAKVLAFLPLLTTVAFLTFAAPGNTQEVDLPGFGETELIAVRPGAPPTPIPLQAGDRAWEDRRLVECHPGLHVHHLHRRKGGAAGLHRTHWFSPHG